MAWSSPEIADWKKIEVIAAEPIAEASCWMRAEGAAGAAVPRRSGLRNCGSSARASRQSGVVPVRWSKSPRTQPT